MTARSSEPNALVIQAGDDVAVLLRPVGRGDAVIVRIGCKLGSIIALEPIPVFHKVALRDIRLGEKVVRGGIAIGEATEAVQTGAWIHVHNLVSRRAQRPDPSAARSSRVRRS